MRRNTRSSVPPEAFRYQAEVLPLDEEQELVARIQELPLKEFEFHGYVVKQRTLSYGWHNDFTEARLRPAEEIPPFLHKAQPAHKTLIHCTLTGRRNQQQFIYRCRCQ
jgi:hypothetical protein